MLENNFKFSEDYLRDIKKVNKGAEERTIIGFKKNEFGEPVVTTGIPVQTQPNKVSHAKVKTISYDNYMFDEMQRTARKR